MAPFPYLPMIAIMSGLVSQQVVQMSIFAYAGFMVEFLGVVDDKDEAGYYAGILSSGFMIGRIFSSNFWGLVADRYGSRFVLIWGLVATAVLSTAFGFSKTFAFAFVCRFLLGLFNGMMPASKTLVTEVCGMEHGTVGMGLVTSAWSIGAILGPGVGGMLAQPASYYPGTFSQDGVFGRNPYLLSNLVGAGLSLVSLPIVLVFIKNNKRAGLGNPPGKPWYSSWLRFFTRRGGSNHDSSNGSNSRSGCSGEEGRTSPNYPDYTTTIEACGIRKPSWMEPETMPPTTTTTGGKLGSSTDGKFLSAIEAFKKRTPSWMMQRGTLPPTTDIKKSRTDGKDDRKPSWMQPEAMPTTTTTTTTTTTDGRRSASGHGAERIGRKPKEIKQESLLKQRHVVLLLFMEAVYSTSYSGFDEVYALWALSSASKGGLEWSSRKIGTVFFGCGLLVLSFELFAVPYLTPWLGVKLSQRLGSLFEVPIYFLFPLLSRIGDNELTTFAALVMLFTAYVCTNSFFVGTALAINEAVPERRGELNGISTAITSVTRSASPIISASVFAYSINSGHGFPINHHLAFAMLGSMRLMAACIGWNKITDNGNME